MAINKKDSFNLSSIRLALFAKVLSHPARIEILRILAERNTCMCGELVIEMPLAQSTVSQHLKELKNVGLIIGEIDGPRSCYCLNTKCIEEMETLFSGLFSSVINKCKC